MIPATVIYKERFLESVASDLTTFAFLALCIWFSNDQGGGWWTFFTACMFLVFLSAKVAALTGQRVIKLKTKADALRWAKSLPDEEEAA